MSDLRDFTGKNRKFTGNVGERISTGETGQRVDTQGVIRFNTTTNLMEYYSGTDWKSIDAPPVITGFTVDDVGGSSVTSARIDSSVSGNATIEVLGSLFDTTGATVTFVGSSETLSTATIVRDSANKLTVTIPRSGFDNTNEPYTIKVTNGSGLSAELAEAITQDQAPVFTNAADTNFNIFDSLRSSLTIAAADLAGATDADSETITYSISTGSLPSGLSIASATGVITGTTAAVGTDTVTTFTVSAATTAATSTRQFTITQKAPSVTTYNSTAAFTYAVPSGVSSVKALVIAGGGGGGSVIGGGGGAGGLVEATAYPVTPGGNVAGNVGGGGAGQPGTRTSNGQQGQNSTFGNITSYGGGGGNSWSTPGASGMPGGSGGGGSHGQGQGGNSTQTSFTPVNATGYGHPGHAHAPANTWGGAGGGAGSGGPVNSHRRTGGDGRASNVSGSPVTYAGGGGGAGHGQGGGSTGGTGGGGNANTSTGQAGTANRGSGGGGGYHPPDVPGGSGGSGIVIVNF